MNKYIIGHTGFSQAENTHILSDVR